VTRRAAFALACLLSAASPAFAGADDPAGAASEPVIRVTPQARDGVVVVSFATEHALTAPVEQAIRSGLPTTFTYDVELRQSSMFWFDKLVGSARIAVMVRYEALTRRYHVSLMQDGRVAEARETDQIKDVRRWVSVFQGLPLFTTRELRRTTAYYVRVRGLTTPRSTWSLWPWRRPSAIGSAALTFLP
jgi:hypothetical protein